MTKEYYRTTIVFEVLSTEELGDKGLKEILDICTDGHFSGDVKSSVTELVTEGYMEHLLIAQRSSPDFLLGDDWYAKQELEKIEFAFKSTGSRSVELAERIDELREQIEETENE